MKRFAYTQQDRRMQTTVLPPFAIIFGWLLYGPAFWNHWQGFLLSTLITLVVCWLSWVLSTFIAYQLRRLLPHYRQTVLRLIITTPLLLVHINVYTLLLYWGFQYLDLFGFLADPIRLRWAFAFCSIVGLVMMIFYESIYAFERWQQTLTETEQLKKANLQSQFESLKQQISPHFLFNSLNSLSSLIEDDPDKAEIFLDELSNVYRYLLRSNESELTTLSSELEFVHSYFYLLRIRYGEGIRLVESINQAYSHHLISPLTLQLLVENAVKHNVILPEQPLTIEITTTPQHQLVVQNTLQRRNLRVPSNRVGLSNISTKYQLLGQGEVLVQEIDGYFRVSLPLLVSSPLATVS